MDTRQLAAFCAVVERRSFSQAAEVLGALRSPPCRSRCAPSRSGSEPQPPRPLGPPRRADRVRAAAVSRCAEATDARGTAPRRRSLRGRRVTSRATLSLGASTGPRRDRGAAGCSASSSGSTPRSGSRSRCTTRARWSSWSLTGVLELGTIGDAPRHRAVRFEPFAEDEVVLVCPSDAPLRRAHDRRRRALVRDAHRHAGGSGGAPGG